MPRAKRSSKPALRTGATAPAAAAVGRTRVRGRATGAARGAASRSRTAADRRRVMQELRALAHPLRLRLLEMFAGSPRTTMQVATLMGEPPTRLYHHVNALEKAGILQLEHTRQVRGTTEKYFKLAHQQLGIVRSRDLTPSSRRMLRSLATSVFDEARAELSEALARRGRLTQDAPPVALRMLMSVPASHQKRVRRRIQAMVRAIRRDLEGCRAPAVPRWALTLAFAPTGAKK